MAPILKDLRTAAGLTVEQAAERIGVSRATVYAWESGMKEPDKANLAAAADAYSASEADRVRLAMARAYGETPTEANAEGTADTARAAMIAADAATRVTA